MTPKFIVVTEGNEKKIYVNINHILSVQEFGGRTVLAISQNNFHDDIRCIQSVDEVMEKIEHVSNKED